MFTSYEVVYWVDSAGTVLVDIRLLDFVVANEESVGVVVRPISTAAAARECVATDKAAVCTARWTLIGLRPRVTRLRSGRRRWKTTCGSLFTFCRLDGRKASESIPEASRSATTLPKTSWSADFGTLWCGGFGTERDSSAPALKLGAQK